MTKSEKIEQLIDLQKVPAFIKETRAVATALEKALAANDSDASKLLGVWDVFVHFDLYSEADLPVDKTAA